MSAPEPVVVRMFVDDVSGIGLWPERHTLSQRDLPVPAELRSRIQAWVDEYTASVLGPRDQYGEGWALDHSWLGHDLSEELQTALGADYLVEYEPRVRAGRSGEPLQVVRLDRLSASMLDSYPPVPIVVRERLLGWIRHAGRFVDDPAELRAERHDWADEGRALVRELQRLWGQEYDVRLG